MELAMLTKRQLIAAYNKGLLDQIATECQRYGVVNASSEWYTEDGYHAGAHRVLTMTHHGIEWEVHKHNGETKSVGYKVL